MLPRIGIFLSRCLCRAGCPWHTPTTFTYIAVPPLDMNTNLAMTGGAHNSRKSTLITRDTLISYIHESMTEILPPNTEILVVLYVKMPPCGERA